MGMTETLADRFPIAAAQLRRLRRNWLEYRMLTALTYADEKARALGHREAQRHIHRAIMAPTPSPTPPQPE